MRAVEETKESATRLFRDYGGAILIAVFAALGIRSFVLEAYRIPSSAMRPSLEPGDTIFVLKYPYGIRNPWTTRQVTDGRAPERGEVVIYSSSGGIEGGERDFIKRVVGMPGDRIEFKRGRLWINGRDVSAGSANDAACGNETLESGGGGDTKAGPSYQVCWEPPLLADSTEPILVPADSYFVLGDLRSRSTEGTKPSRVSWGGLIQRSQLKGKAAWIWLSVEPSGGFSRIRFERMFKRIP